LFSFFYVNNFKIWKIFKSKQILNLIFLIFEPLFTNLNFLKHKCFSNMNNLQVWTFLEFELFWKIKFWTVSKFKQLIWGIPSKNQVMRASEDTHASRVKWAWPGNGSARGALGGIWAHAHNRVKCKMICITRAIHIPRLLTKT
jgi:hypothetical protein